ncbi:MAG: GGDEF domain-containing protein [Planctomycetota bacterium]|jgi:diguanylate cyclase (GGDEF)-like protein|nr:GGDEF domain-containing protein [Planctomycetota bacterium]
MTDDERLAFGLLRAFDFAVLRRAAPGRYVFWGQAPAFYDAVFPPVAGAPCAAPWENSAMLDFFLQEAEAFFEAGEAGCIHSGVWEEDGLTQADTALKATAANLGEWRVVIIQLLRQEYAERRGIMRKAREQLRENRQLAANLSIFKEKSRIDGLTSIFNRTTFMELLLDEMKRSRIMEYPLVLLILDIDDFKKVNDTYGHLVGDKVLRGMGTVLKNSLRQNDIVARYGGEEFAVLITHASLDEGMRVAEKVRAALAAMIVPDAPRITVSIGCSAYIPDEPPEEFIARSDAGLYAAKKAGKNKVRVM